MSTDKTNYIYGNVQAMQNSDMHIDLGWLLKAPDHAGHIVQNASHAAERCRRRMGGRNVRVG